MNDIIDNDNPSAALTLTPAQRRELRALAHDLAPVVSIAQKGLTSAVLQEIERCLAAHELVKIRVFDAEREAREALLADICAQLEAAPVQHIGKLLIVWRPRPEAETAAVRPAAKRRTAPRLTKKAAAAKTERSAKATPRRRTHS